MLSSKTVELVDVSFLQMAEAVEVVQVVPQELVKSKVSDDECDAGFVTRWPSMTLFVGVACLSF